MKRILLLLAALVLVMLEFGCNDAPVLQPTPAAKPSNHLSSSPSGLVPDGYYSLAWNPAVGYADFELISKTNGLGTPIWTISGLYAWMPDPMTLGVTPFGLAFDLDGSIYTIANSCDFDETRTQGRLARIDGATGALTYIGPIVDRNYCGPDIDSKGNLYVCGMDVPHLGYIHGTGRLYKVDKVTGAFTEVGPLNVEITDWMDLAFDSQDHLYGTTRNKLFSIDTNTGAITSVLPITGVPGDPPPAPYHLMQEIMSIAFDQNDVLYGTAMNVEWDTGHGSPVMRIDTRSGQATVVGYTEQGYNHGGDIMPAKVRVAHKTANGEYHCIDISMDALADHLAHGDYVPGTAGHDSGCPSASNGKHLGE